MNILVTGGAGFIGSHFVLRHKAEFPDDLVVVLDALRTGSDKSFLAPVIDRLRFIEGDIADAGLVEEILNRYEIETIVNFAAETHVDRSIDNAIPFLHTNVIGVQSLIEVCRKHPQVLLLHISTDEVYGDLLDTDEPKRESDPLRPSSPYAATKASGDLLILAAVRTYGIRARITRCTNNYGPHQASEKFIPTAIRYALQNQKIPLYGTGKNKRDWLFVHDHCDAVEVVLRASGVDGWIFNISANAERDNTTIAKTILQQLQKPLDQYELVADRPGHDWRYALNSDVIRELGWQPKVTFEEGMQQTVAWYQNRAQK
jgi:dTDP-glucose 4,6-dehydratase